MTEITARLPEKAKALFNCEDKRYVILYGGRGSGKSHSIAQILILMATQRPLRILCVREFQSTMKESCHKLLCDYIEKFHLQAFFDTTNNRILGLNGSEFIFRGIRLDPGGIKSLEGIDIAWCEEGQSISAASMEILIPTVRNPGSQIWCSMNPNNIDDPIYKMILSPPPRSLIIEMNYLDNPFCSQELIEEADYLKSVDYDLYRHIWLGEVQTLSDAVIFKGKYEIREFNSPDKADFYYGLDFGYGPDPMAFTRCFVEDYILYIDYAEIHYGVELDEYGPILRKVPGANRWKIYADCASPGNISLIRRSGFQVEGAKKWAGSIEDGISHIKSYRKIVIHPRCVKLIEEFSKYSWRIDKVTGDPQPIPQDTWNHGIDSIRYALSKRILNTNLSLEGWKAFNK